MRSSLRSSVVTFNLQSLLKKSGDLQRAHRLMRLKLLEITRHQIRQSLKIIDTILKSLSSPPDFRMQERSPTWSSLALV